MADAHISCEHRGEVCLLTMQGPPVNAFSLAMRSALLAALQSAETTPSVKAIVLAGYGRGFSAGGDITEFGTPNAKAEPGLSSHIHVQMESMSKPIVAAIHGFALGGGLETALVCHYRVADEGTTIGLPEVGLGTIALSATQRLPRVLDLTEAFELMHSGIRCAAGQFSHTPLFDELVIQGQAVTAAIALANRLIAQNIDITDLKQRLLRNKPLKDQNPMQSLKAINHSLDANSTPAVHALVKALEAAAYSEHFDQGIDVARGLYDQLMEGDEVMQQRKRFINDI